MKRIVLLTLALALFLGGCEYSESSETETTNVTVKSVIVTENEVSETNEISSSTTKTSDSATQNTQSSSSSKSNQTSTTIQTSPVKVELSKAFEIPRYEGKDYIVINNDIPYFMQSELTAKAYETYSPLDSLGRCGVCTACIGKELMPTEERGSIGMIKPSGWQLSKYDFFDGKYLFNRCHLIGYQLTGENANERNLITGTRYMNIGRMLDLENMTASYIRRTGNHVLYRVTPCFEGNNLVATGVLMEAYSIEDSGKGVKFCNFVFNIQPNVSINYADGTNTLISAPTTTSTQTAKTTTQAAQNTQSSQSASREFVLNKNTKKYHETWCSSVKDIKDKNKGTYTGTEEELQKMGYSACKKCH